MTTPLLCLLGYSLLTLALAQVLVADRVSKVLTGSAQANSFRPHDPEARPFVQRLERAHANCLENLPLFIVVVGVDHVVGPVDPAGTLASIILAARVAQSTIHLVSIEETAVHLRFTAYLVQVLCLLGWMALLLSA